MSEGHYFEDLGKGKTYQHFPGRTITEFDDMWFSCLTLTTNPLHIDAHYAAQTQHGQRLVNGLLVFSIVVGMSVRDISLRAVANLEYEAIKHLAPTFHGDTLYAETTVLDKWESKSKPDRGVVYVETRASNQRGETVLTFRRKVLLYKRGAGPSMP
ncbi:MAG: MaoC family dehydratase [Candidatus Methylomirabilales bacterium]